MTDFDDMKSKWQALSHADPSTATESWTGLDPRRKSQLQKVRRTFLMLTVVSAVCSFVVPFNLLAFATPHWLVIVTCVYFIVCMLVNLWLRITSAGIDIASSTAAEVMQRVELILRVRMLFKFILLPVAIVIIGFMLYYVSYDMAAVIGGLSGGAVGGAIGYCIDRRIRYQLRSIAADLHTI